MILSEILDKPIHFEVTEDSQKYFQAEFKAGDREIVFDAEQEIEYGTNDDGEDEDFPTGKWEIAFVQRDPETGLSRWDITKSGNEFAVFATLKEILKTFIKKYDPKVLRFDAAKKDRARADLYQRLFLRNLPTGYEIDRSDTSSTRNSKFTITKK